MSTALSVLGGLCLGCSFFGITSDDGVDVLGRSMEINGMDPLTPRQDLGYDWQLVKSAKGTMWNSTNAVTHDCKGLSTTGWVVQHPWVGIGFTNDSHRITDGMNAEGLSIQVHTFRGSHYQTPGAPEDSLCYKDFTTWALSSFARVEELVAALKTMRVVALPGISPDGQLHWQVSDAYGGSVAIEYIKGVLRAHNNTVRVLTNDPSFTWHLENVNNYVPLTTKWPMEDRRIQVETEVGIVPNEISHGINLLGLPGDSSPPGRFIRLFYLKQFAQLNVPARTFDEAFVLANSLLNTVYIPKGVLSHKNENTDPTSDFTEFTTIKVPQKREYYYRTYHNTQWRKVDLTAVQWGEGFTSVSIVTPTDMGVRDVTADV